jgi:hypothetical protein
VVEFGHKVNGKGLVRTPRLSSTMTTSRKTGPSFDMPCHCIWSKNQFLYIIVKLVLAEAGREELEFGISC